MSYRTRTFSVEGVTPLTELPPMTPEEGRHLMTILRACLVEQTGWQVKELRRDMIDWLGG
jgi:hypothetical protein